MSVSNPRRPSAPPWPFELPGAGRHFVYRLCGVIPGVDPDDEDVASIYVGVTSNLAQRLGAHARKWWWVAVVPDLCELLEYATREDAEAAERLLIHWHQPAMNRAGRLLIVS